MKNLYSLILFFLASTLVASAQNTCTPLITNGLIAYYPFCGNANDASGNNYNGSVSGASLTTDRFGNANSAYSFTSGSYISVLDAVPLRLNNTDFTISSWVFLNDTLPQSVNYGSYAIVTKRDNSGGYFFAITSNNYTVPIAAGYTFYQVAGGGQPRCFSNSIIGIQKWQLVTITYSYSTQTLKTYINGALNATSTGMPSPTGSTTANLWIGNDVSGSPYYFHGKLDDISIYNRILSDNEINQLYTATSSNCLIAYYPFTGNPADSSGNGYNGTVYGAMLTTDRFGNPNSAYSFQSGNYISVADAIPIRLANTDFTMGAWVYLTDTLPTSVNYGMYAIASKRGLNTTHGDGYIFGINAPENNNGSIAGVVAYQVSGGGDPRAYSNSTINLNSWQHVLITYLYSAQTMKTYINGVLNSTVTGIPASNATTYPSLWIGNDVSGSPYYFHGKIDEVRIYNCALTDAEVLNLYNGTTTAVKENITDQELNIYPNPLTDQFIIHYSSLHSNEALTISLINMLGQVVQEEKVRMTNDVMISVKTLRKGIYFLQLQGEKSKWIGKIVKE